MTRTTKLIFYIIIDGYEFLMQNCMKVDFPIGFYSVYYCRQIWGPNLYIWIFSWRIHSPWPGRYDSQSMYNYFPCGICTQLLQVGLLPTCNHQQVPFAYAMYTRADKVGWQQSDAFKKAFSVDVPIEFLGVWYVVCLPCQLSIDIGDSGIR